MEWPEIDYDTLTFATEETEKRVWARALDAALADITIDHSEELEDKIEAFKQALIDCGDWSTPGSSSYRTIIEDFVRIHATLPNEVALDVAQAGLEALQDSLQFRLDSHTSVPAKDVFVLTGSFPKLPTSTLVGSKAPDLDFQFGLADPKDPTNEDTHLYGLKACAQIDAWHKYGLLETSASVLAKTTLTAPNLPSLFSSKVFVLLGCTSEVGPAKSLLKIPGVTVLGIARGGPKLDALIDYARYNAPDDTTFIYPSKGADLITESPQIVQWILDQTKESQELVVMPLATSVDGEVDVRLSVAMDLIIQRIFRQRRKSVLSQILSPTQVLVVPPACATNAEERLQDRPSWEQWTHSLTGGRWLKPSLPESNNDYALLNGLLSSQGPCYALARMVQVWRAMVAYYRDAHIVVSPFGALTHTESQRSERAVFLDGLVHFTPLLALEPDVSSTLLASISLAGMQFLNRPLPDMDENPYTMFWEGSVSGGVWTCPYMLESIATVNWAVGKSGYYPRGYLPPESLPPPPQVEDESSDQEPKPRRDPGEILMELADREFTEPMPDCVKERLDFM